MKAQELLHILYRLSSSDGQISKEEVSFLVGIAKQIGADHLTLDDIKTQAVDVSTDYPKEEKDRMTILYYLLFLMKADKNIDAEEKKTVYHYGFKLGFSELMVTEMIEIIENKIDSKIPAEELLQIIIRHNN